MPKILGPSPFDRWENRVMKELRDRLPEDWVVVSDVGYQWRNNDGYIRDGQADFVVLVPELGLAVVEVKGTRKIWVSENGLWFKIDRYGKKKELDKLPPEQAKSNMYNLSRKLGEELVGGIFPGLIGWLVVYPNGEVGGKLDTYFPESVVEKKTLHRIKHAIENVLRAGGSEGKGREFNSNRVEQSQRILTNGNFIVKAVDTDIDVEEDNEEIEELTRQQYAALKGAFELPSVSVIGPAGSGKTILAIWKLKALVTNGTKVLFVCYNKSLAEYLRSEHTDYADYIVSVDKYFLGLVPDRYQAGSDYFEVQLPNKVVGHFFCRAPTPESDIMNAAFFANRLHPFFFATFS